MVWLLQLHLTLLIRLGAESVPRHEGYTIDYYDCLRTGIGYSVISMRTPRCAGSGKIVLQYWWLQLHERGKKQLFLQIAGLSLVAILPLLSVRWLSNVLQPLLGVREYSILEVLIHKSLIHDLLTHMKIHSWWYMAYIALILHVNGILMIIIHISACIHIHPACILHIKDSVCIELLGVLCNLLKNIGGARAPLAPSFLRLCITLVYGRLTARRLAAANRRARISSTF